MAAASIAEVEGRNSDDFKGEMMAAHNFFRDQHGARPLVWNKYLAQKAQNWANTCENLVGSTGFTNWGALVNMWGSERTKYNWGKPGFPVNTGHFTQVVWKNSMSLGCGWNTGWSSIPFHQFSDEIELG
ncbi:Cell wall protein PRY3 [Metarhizium anisopliae]